MDGQQGPAFDPAALASGGSGYLSHAEGLDGQAKALEQLASLRTAFAGTAEQHWPAMDAGVTGARGQIQQSAQSYLAVGQALRALADGGTAIDVASVQGITSTGQGGADSP